MSRTELDELPSTLIPPINTKLGPSLAAAGRDRAAGSDHGATVVFTGAPGATGTKWRAGAGLGDGEVALVPHAARTVEPTTKAVALAAAGNSPLPIFPMSHLK